MKQYTVWMDVTETWKIAFKAKDLDDAKQIIEQLNSDKLDPDNVTDYDEKNKGLEKFYDVGTLEEWEVN